MTEVILPTSEEVKKWMLFTLKHSCHVEYFLKGLDLGKNDPERPHELIGTGNKYDWDVIKGFALLYRRPKVDSKTHIIPALRLHGQQYHHRMWDNPDPDDETKYNPEATGEDMLFGAVDANCSLLENREYQGGKHSYEEIIEVAKKNPPHKAPWMLKLVPQMQKLEQPKLELITSLHDFPNIGLPEYIYDLIVGRTRDTIKLLNSERGYNL